jgi:DnaJ-domain-containing protein 1
VSISKRLIDLARSELNSLLDRAARLGDSDDTFDGDADAGPHRRSDLDALSDRELEAELERRRLAREAAERQTRTRREAGAAESATRQGGARSHAPPRRPPPAPEDEIRRAYAALEVPAGSDFATVRRSYRTLMRKYHPDRHTQSPEKQKAANELAQKLTDAYKKLERRLRK